MANGTPDRMQTLRDLAIGAVAMVVGAALLFALVGAVSDDGPDITATDDPDPTATSPTDPQTPTPDPSDGSATDAPVDTPSADPSAVPSPDVADPTDAPSTPADRIDPASVTIQVLDGVLDDGQATHDQIVACLREDGYGNLIAGNRARTAYAETVVFYTAGSQDAATQVAADLGVGRVEEQPGNLSEDVPVHIVVGADGAC